MTLTTEETQAKEVSISLVNKGWDEHHADQVEFWLLRYYLNDTEFKYQDNLRIARSWVPAEVREYDKKQKSGCCGSVDDGLSTVEGGTIRVGFNHGH
jgi:hypothetical protein